MPEVTIPEATRDWGRVSRSERAVEAVLALPDTADIPIELYEATDIPFARPYAYTVSIYGRAMGPAERVAEAFGATARRGQFVRQDFDLTTNRRLTKEEIKAMAAARIGLSGSDPLVDILDIDVAACWVREE